MSLIDILKRRPAAFDLAKRASRLLGRVNPLYSRMAADARLHVDESACPVTAISAGPSAWS